MVAYLDNQVISGIQDKRLDIHSIVEHTDKSINSLAFSAAHVWEAEAYQGTSIESRKRFLTNRLKALHDIAGKRYLYFNQNTKRVDVISRTPQEVMTDIKSGRDLAKPAMKSLVNFLPEAVKSKLRGILTIESKELNNLSPSELIERSIDILAPWGLNYSLHDWIERSVSLHPNGLEFGLYHRFSALFELLDLMGYWKDEYKRTSNYARHWDAQHAFFAGHCGYLISDDKKMRKKARVAYALYGFKTTISDSKGIIEE